MLPNANNETRTDLEGFRSYMKETEVFSAGMNPKLHFLSAGVAPEPIRTWDDSQRKYVDPIVGYRYPVVQDVTDGNSTFRQNPVMVRVDGEAVNLSFGDEVVFEDLLGYRNKQYKYSFQAAAIKKVK